MRNVTRLTAALMVALAGPSAPAEQLCFRSSECEMGEICQAVKGSAVGICRSLQAATDKWRLSHPGESGPFEQPENGWLRPDAGFDFHEAGGELR